MKILNIFKLITIGVLILVCTISAPGVTLKVIQYVDDCRGRLSYPVSSPPIPESP